MLNGLHPATMAMRMPSLVEACTTMSLRTGGLHYLTGSSTENAGTSPCAFNGSQHIPLPSAPFNLVEQRE